MKRIYITTTATLAALLLITALSKCSLPRPAVAHLVAAGNITVTGQEILVGWADGSAILRLSTAETIGEIVLILGDNTFCSPAHCYAEAPGIWFADWGHNGDHLRVFANGHAEGRVNGKDIYFTPLGSGQCFPE